MSYVGIGPRPMVRFTRVSFDVLDVPRRDCGVIYLDHGRRPLAIVEDEPGIVLISYGHGDEWCVRGTAVGVAERLGLEVEE